MSKRTMGAVCLLLLILGLMPLHAGERVFTIRAGSPVDHAQRTYPTLEALRQALEASPPNAYLDDQSVITLHNDDKSLTDPINFPAGRRITVRSAGGAKRTIRCKNTSGGGTLAPFQSDGGAPALSVENIRFVDSSGYMVDAIYSNNTGAGAGSLNITGSDFLGDGPLDVMIYGSTDATITNSVFAGGRGFAIQAAGSLTGIGGEVNLDIVFDRSAPEVVTWTKGLLFGNGVSLNVDVADGKKFDLRNVAQGQTSTAVTKTGGGTWSVRGGQGTVTIREGTMHFYAGDDTGDTSWAGNNLHVGKNGTLKVSVTPGNLAPDTIGNWTGSHASRFTLGTFTSEEGARLEIGGISRFPAFSSSHYTGSSSSTFQMEVGYGMIYLPGPGNVAASTVAKSMTINNKLMRASLKPADLTQLTLDASLGADPLTHNGYILHIENVNNLSILDGVGTYADVYRRMNLSDFERDMLDGIYNRGGTDSDIGFLQTIGGSHVQGSLLAMRHNQANTMLRINSRMTEYQRGDIYDLSVQGGELCDYSEWTECPDYGEMWAFIDQTWMSQNDVDNLTGYRYQNHTLGVGYDWHSGSWIYGGLLTYNSGKMKLRKNYGANTDVDQVMAALYASWGQDGWYVTGTGLAGYGWNESNSSYTLPGFATAASTGNYATSMFGLSAEFGYMYETEFQGVPLRVTPYGDLTYARLHRNRAREGGAEFGTVNMNRQFRATNWHMWEVAAGARISVPIERGPYTLIPSLDVAWTRTLGEPETGGGDAHFIGRGDTSGWKIPVMAGNRSSLRLAANLDAHIRENLSVGAGYEFEWRESYWKHQINVGLNLGF